VDTVVTECQSLPAWPEPECRENLFLSGDRALFLREILRFLGSVTLIMVTGLLLLLAA
jgi:hypothetical protein